MARFADAYLCCKQNLFFKKAFLKQVISNMGLDKKELKELFCRVELICLKSEEIEQTVLQVCFSEKRVIGLFDTNVLKQAKIPCKKLLKKIDFKEVDFYIKFVKKELDKYQVLFIF